MALIPPVRRVPVELAGRQHGKWGGHVGFGHLKPCTRRAPGSGGDKTNVQIGGAWWAEGGELGVCDEAGAGESGHRHLSDTDDFHGGDSFEPVDRVAELVHAGDFHDRLRRCPVEADRCEGAVCGEPFRFPGFLIGVVGGGADDPRDPVDGFPAHVGDVPDQDGFGGVRTGAVGGSVGEHERDRFPPGQRAGFEESPV